jgi:CheY-like chemotaxis protein
VKTILVAEDNAAFRTVVAHCLRSAGYLVTCAADGREALDLLMGGAAKPAAPFDLVLLDVAMPAVNGISVLREIRASPALSGVPVILMTAMSDRDVAGLTAGLDVRAQLMKSRFSMAELRAAVAEHAGARASGTADTRAPNA